MEETTPPVKTTDTVIRILEGLQTADGARVSELADDMDLARSTIHRHLTTLHQHEYVVKEGDMYYIGLQFLNLGEYARSRHNAYRMAKLKVEELAEETAERVQFIVEEHGHAVYVYRKRGGHAVQTDPGIGKRIPIYATAAGKAILAHLPEPTATSIIEQSSFKQITDETITNRETLLKELEVIRERGYSFNKEENIEGLHAVGAAVLGPDSRVLGALSISGPAHRLKGNLIESELPDLLLGTVNELELNIAHA